MPGLSQEEGLDQHAIAESEKEDGRGNREDIAEILRTSGFSLSNGQMEYWSS
jgi:hypothetical protein